MHTPWPSIPALSFVLIFGAACGGSDEGVDPAERGIELLEAVPNESLIARTVIASDELILEVQDTTTMTRLALVVNGTLIFEAEGDFRALHRSVGIRLVPEETHLSARLDEQRTYDTLMACARRGKWHCYLDALNAVRSVGP